MRKTEMKKTEMKKTEMNIKSSCQSQIFTLLYDNIFHVIIGLHISPTYTFSGAVTTAYIPILTNTN
jgi:hypothetical protein